MIDQMIKAIPEGGELKISLRRTNNKIQAIVHRDFKQGNTPPLAISGSESEMIEALPDAIAKFRRATSPMEQVSKQVNKAALESSKKPGKASAATPAKSKSSETVVEEKEELDLGGTIFDEN